MFYHKRLNNLVVTLFLALFLLSICPSPSLSKEHSRKATRTFSQSRKIKNPDLILDDFIKGNSKTRVIANLEKPLIASEMRNLKHKGIRQQLKQAVRAAQDNVIIFLDAKRVCITNRFEYIFGLSAEVTLQGLQDLIDNDNVVSIEKDHIIHAHLAQGIPLMNASTVRTDYDGVGLSIAICDTGIDYNHPKLGGGGFPNNKVIGGYDTGDDDDDPIDLHGHGTSCAGIAAGDLGDTGDYIGGVAHGAKLYAVKISLGSSGRAWISDMIEGWEWCITHQDDDPDNPIMIIGTSFGGFRFLEVCDEASVAMTQAAANAVAAGMTLFASSGNDGFCDSLSWPACISHVISVGAVFDANIGGWGFCVDRASCAPNQERHPLCNPDRIAWAYTTQGDQETPYSNKASFLDLFAPSHFTYTTDAGGGYNATFGGTSAACPYAAGAAACLQSAAKALTGSFLSPNDVRLKLSESGDLITEIKGDIIKPRVNLGAAVDSIGPPVIDDISFDECVSGLCTSNITVTAYDPQGGELTYDWEALDGGEIIGEGADVLFDPPDAGPHPCPYRVGVTATSGVSGLSVSQGVWIYVTLAGDFDHDGDVDGSDMSIFAADLDRMDCDTGEPCEGDFDHDGDVDGSDLAISAAYFGRTDGCACP